MGKVEYREVCISAFTPKEIRVIKLENFTQYFGLILLCSDKWTFFWKCRRLFRPNWWYDRTFLFSIEFISLIFTYFQKLISLGIARTTFQQWDTLPSPASLCKRYFFHNYPFEKLMVVNFHLMNYKFFRRFQNFADGNSNNSFKS